MPPASPILPPQLHPSKSAMYHLNFALLLVLLALVNNVNAQNNWAAAECAGLGPRCPRSVAKTSGHCFAGLWMSSQPAICRQAACEYCRLLDRRVTQSACQRESIDKNCFSGPPPSSTGTPPESRPRTSAVAPTTSGGGSTGGTCRVFFGSDGKLVIPTNRLKLVSDWSRNSDGSMTWKKDGGSGIDSAGSGAICAKFRVPSAGTYYMTVISKAPHPTEYNDAWFKLSAGVDLYRPEGNKWKEGGSGWYKGYQNEGKNTKADYIVTVDFDGHQFISNSLSTDKEYEVCVSGRSAMYTIYQFVFIKCEGRDGCNRYNSPIKNAMRSLPQPRC